MAEGKTNLFGKTYNTIGSTDSNFIIKTKGDLKILWGNKFIDVIKNGKIVSENSEILFLVESPDEILKNGVYIVTTEENNELWVCIDGVKVQINNTTGENVYVSFMMELKTTSDLQHQALTNIGFYYETLLKAKSAKINSGIIYVEEDNKLYIAKNGDLVQYSLAGSGNSEDNINKITREPLYIEGYSLYADGTEYILCSGELTKLLQPVIVYNGILSNDANAEFGFRLFIEDSNAILDVDIVNWRNYPNPIKHAELLTRILNKTLNPKMYYLLTDFQNPWEVTWENEPKYYEDEYEEINGEQHLCGKRNSMLLIIQAKSTSELEEVVESPMNPEWVIHYDPLFLGPEHVVGKNENGEDIILYGYRSRIIEEKDEKGNVIKETTQYLLCKGQITYLKDELWNEGNFNFRLFMFRHGNKREGTAYWRYCADLEGGNEEVYFGEFGNCLSCVFKLGMLEAQIQVFKFERVLDDEGNLLKYQVKDIDSDIYLSKGHHFYMYSSSGTLVVSNTFELKKSVLNTITMHKISVPNFRDNTFIDIEDLGIICDGMMVRDNYFENIKGGIEIHNLECTDNIIIDMSDDLGVLIDGGTLFYGNKLSNFKKWLINKIEFGNNTINGCENIITNNNKMIGNTIDNIVGTITNDGEMLNNTITSIEGVLINGSLSMIDNIITTVSTLTNNGNFIKNTADRIVSITNDESCIIENNIFTVVKNLINKQTITNNTFKNIEELSNEGVVTDNIFEKVNSLINTGTIDQNQFGDIIELTNSLGTISGNLIGNILSVNNNESAIISNNTIETVNEITNAGIVTNNIIDIIEELTNNDAGSIEDNIIKTITKLNNSGNIINNTIDHIEELTNSIQFESNVINYLKSSFTEESIIIQGNTINRLLDDNSIKANLIRNTINTLQGCTIEALMLDNKFNNLNTVVFTNVILDNNVLGNINDSTIATFTSNEVYKNISETTISVAANSCVFNKPISKLTAEELYYCAFNYINNLSLELYTPIYHTTFHGNIGGDNIRTLTNHEQNLLSNPSKKTEVYPNIRVTCVPEIIMKGMILMWYGKEPIPNGWALCDGKNGTPNLVGSFIKAESFTDENPTQLEGLDDDNGLILSVDNLPEHHHPHNLHHHYFESTGFAEMFDDYAEYNGPYQVQEGEGNLAPSGDDRSLTSEKDTVSFTVSGNTSAVESTEKAWEYNNPPTPIKLEPKHFKIIFIMKIDENLEES